MDKTWGAISKFFSDTWNSIVKIVSSSTNWIVKNVTNFLNAVQKVWNSIWKAISNFFEDIWNGIVKIYNNVSNTLSKGISVTLKFIQNVWNTTWVPSLISLETFGKAWLNSSRQSFMACLTQLAVSSGTLKMFGQMYGVALVASSAESGMVSKRRQKAALISLSALFEPVLVPSMVF